MLLPFGSQEMYNAGMMPCFSLFLSIFPSLSAPCIMVMACVYNIPHLLQSFALFLVGTKAVGECLTESLRRADEQRLFTPLKKRPKRPVSDETLMNPHLYTQRVASFLVRLSLGFGSFLALPLYVACFISRSFAPCCVCSYTITTCIEGSQHRCVAGRVSLSCTRESSLFALMSYS